MSAPDSQPSTAVISISQGSGTETRPNRQSTSTGWAFADATAMTNAGRATAIDAVTIVRTRLPARAGARSRLNRTVPVAELPRGFGSAGDGLGGGVNPSPRRAVELVVWTALIATSEVGFHSEVRQCCRPNLGRPQKMPSACEYSGRRPGGRSVARHRSAPGLGRCSSASPGRPSRASLANGSEIDVVDRRPALTEEGGAPHQRRLDLRDVDVVGEHDIAVDDQARWTHHDGE